jgi:maleate cis-trans isomerase
MPRHGAAGRGGGALPRQPVIAINTATYWHALRAIGIADRLAGFGRLLEEF